MILLKSPMPLAGRQDVWASEVVIREISPARRDKLFILLNLVGFNLQEKWEDMNFGDVAKNGEDYVILLEKVA